MSILDSCIESFEIRASKLTKRLIALENREFYVGLRNAPHSPWRCVTDREIADVRHAVRENETIIQVLKRLG